MSPTFLGAEEPLQARFAELNRLAKEFRMDLVRLWKRAGRPDARRMAEVAQVPEGMLSMFLADRAMPLPSRREVDAILEATATPLGARARWVSRFVHLEQRRTDLERERAADHRDGDRWSSRRAADGPIEQTAVSGALTAALRAQTMPELQSALRQLRMRSGLSLERLAKATSGVFSSSTGHRIETDERGPNRDQVIAFVTACGQAEPEIQLWIRAWEKVSPGIADARLHQAVERPERVEIVRHPVTYLPGGRGFKDEEVINEIRFRITPTVEIFAGVAGFGASLTVMSVVGRRLGLGNRGGLYLGLMGGGAGIVAGALTYFVQRRTGMINQDSFTRFDTMLITAAKRLAAITGSTWPFPRNSDAKNRS